jgi:hypothetical protein
MAGDWIKMKRGLRHDPKVIAIARHLGRSRAFMNWWSDPQGQSCRDHVTEVVTFSNVTRVTVCALLDVWAALNNSITQDGLAPFMELQDIDDMAEVPSFGEAMAAVGWVVEREPQGLEFPNFTENNSPSKSRGKPMSNAERQKAYRERKKQREAEEEALRNVTREKRREEKSIKHPPTPRAGESLMEQQVAKLLACFNISTPVPMIGSEAMGEFLAQPQFLTDEGLAEIKNKAAAWVAQDWIKDVSPKLIAKNLAEIYNYTPKPNAKHSPSSNPGRDRNAGTANAGRASQYADIG